MKSNRFKLLFALMMTASVSAEAPNPPAGHRPPPQPLLPALDANRDGQLDEDEIANASIALGKLDKNSDGRLTRKELLPPPPKKKSGNPPSIPSRRPPLLIATLDLDKDGILSADEIEDAPLSLQILDKDDDGVISRKELNPGKPPQRSDDAT